MRPGGDDVERFFDRAAAEFLVPAIEIRTVWQKVVNSEAPFESLAKRFKVSPLVIGRRAMDLGLIEGDDFFIFYHYLTQTER